ncbi:phytoene desaturase family protein [Rhodococcus sp. 24CO]|uniref:phytoene desaturase family protein n=1 Tax=Rhodococcus sp. 24CO TaxID=3117460 RepID=UPI003D3425C1
MSFTVDAVVVGAGHHGLVAAAALADAGWDVLVLEAAQNPGGAVRSAELLPGYTSDLFSAFYPLAAVSPAVTALELHNHGLRWSHAPTVVGHPRSPSDVDAPVIHRQLARTVEDLTQRCADDGQKWQELFELWQRVRGPLLDTLLLPFPPARGPAQLLRRLGVAESVRLLRFMLLPALQMAEELFRDDAAKALLLGNAMHADIPPDAPGSGTMGFLLAMLAQDVGFPVPVGGAGQLAEAFARRAEAGGAVIRCGEDVARIDVRNGRAVGVRTAGGETVSVRRAVLADVSAPNLYGTLLDDDVVPLRVREDLAHFVWDTPVLKLNYALDQPIPWRAPALRQVGTVHLGADASGVARWMSDLETSRIPSSPFMLFGQMSTADPTRSPVGTESAWAYTHLPRGVSDDGSADTLARRVDDVLEAHAPGFASSVIGRVVQRPSDIYASDANLYGGAVNGGTAQLFQQLFLRPTPGLGRSETPIERLYLASAAAHPGGGVHGACGFNAARAALASDGFKGWPRRRITTALIEVLTRSR